MRNFVLGILVLVVYSAYADGFTITERQPVERSMCFFYSLCGRSRSVTAFCRVFNQWAGIDGSRVRAACSDYHEDFDEDYSDEDEDEDNEDDYEDEDE
jgi:hypothetical protein